MLRMLGWLRQLQARRTYGPVRYAHEALRSTSDLQAIFTFGRLESTGIMKRAGRLLRRLGLLRRLPAQEA